MPPRATVDFIASYSTFGDLLKFLRRRAHLTQLDLGIAVGYSVAHINRFEKNKRVPDPSTVAALFVPALSIEREPELAARLVALATPGHDSATRATPEPAPPPLTESALEPVPVAAPYEIARPHHLDRLRDGLSREGRLVVTGLPGMGKTTLMAMLARERARHMPVFWLTLTEGVTALEDTLIRRLAIFLTLNGYEPARALAERSDSSRAPAPLEQQIAMLADGFARQRALICLDNAHLIARDARIVQVLRHLIATTTVQVVMTSREALPFEITHFRLEGLDREEGSALIACLMGDAAPLDPELAERLLDKTGGSPMLVRLAMGQLVDARADAENFIASLEMQPQVASYLLEHVQERLSTRAWNALALASMFRHPVNLLDESLVKFAHAEKMMDTVRELQRNQLIDAPTRANLHPLIRDYVQSTLALDAACYRRLHQVAARWNEEITGDALEAAFHYTRANKLEQAVDALEADTDRLIALGQALSAAELLDEIEKQLARPRRQENELLRRVLSMRAYLLTGTVRTTDAEADYRAALALTTPSALRASLAVRFGQLLTMRGKFAESLQIAQDAAAALAPNDTLLHAQLAMGECTALTLLSRSDEGLAAGDRALALVNQIQGIAPARMVDEIRARIFARSGDIYRMRGEYATALAGFRQAYEAAKNIGLKRLELSSLNMIGHVLYNIGDLEGAWRARSDALTGALAVGDSYLAGFCLIHLSLIHFDKCEHQAALDKLARAREFLLQVGDPRGLAECDNKRASSLIAMGRVRSARILIEHVVVERQEIQANQVWAYLLTKLGMTQLLDGDPGLALKTLERVAALPSIADDLYARATLHVVLALALIAQKDLARANALIDKMEYEPSDSGELDRYLLETVRSLANGDAARAAELAQEFIERAHATENTHAEAQARRLYAATQNPPPLESLPRIVWVEVRG